MPEEGPESRARREGVPKDLRRNVLSEVVEVLILVELDPTRLPLALGADDTAFVSLGEGYYFTGRCLARWLNAGEAVKAERVERQPVHSNFPAFHSAIRPTVNCHQGGVVEDLLILYENIAKCLPKAIAARQGARFDECLDKGLHHARQRCCPAETNDEVKGVATKFKTSDTAPALESLTP